MGTSLRWRRADHFEYGLTKLELCGPELDIEIRIISRLGKCERRTVMHSFIRQIKPWIHCLKRRAMDHTSDGIIRSQLERNQSVSLFMGKPITSLSGSLGFEIRMKRLKLSMTQAELAYKVGVQRSHLSAIERGLYLPGPETRSALAECLNMEISLLPQSRNCLKKPDTPTIN